MKSIIFSDIQYYHNPSKSQVLSDGSYTWLDEQLRITETIFKYAIDNHISNIIFCGDFFEEKNKINVQTFNKVWSLYAKYRGMFSNFILNTGNHDFYNTNRDSSILPFASLGIQIVVKPCDFAIDGDIVRVIPYGMASDLSLARYGNFKYLVTHENIEGLSFGGSETIRERAIPRDTLKEWGLVFNGHIHKPQNIDNIVNVGSPMIQDWGEEGDVKRFLHVDGDDFKSIEIDCPKFYTLDGISDEIVEKLYEDNRNFYRINVEAAQMSHSIFKKWNVSPHVIKTKKKVIRLTKQESVEDEVKQYVDLSDTQLDKNKLKNIGVNIIHES